MGLKKIEIDYGIACRIDDTIYYNKELKKYPELLKAILKHEKEHSNDFTYDDILLDFKGKYLKGHKKEYYKFILTHPKSLTEFLPVYVYDKKTYINPTMFALWCFILLWIYIMLRIIL